MCLNTLPACMYVSARNPNSVLCRSSKCSSLLRQFLSLIFFPYVYLGLVRGMAPKTLLKQKLTIICDYVIVRKFKALLSDFYTQRYWNFQTLAPNMGIRTWYSHIRFHMPPPYLKTAVSPRRTALTGIQIVTTGQCMS